MSIETAEGNVSVEYGTDMASGDIDTFVKECRKLKVESEQLQKEVRDLRTVVDAYNNTNGAKEHSHARRISRLTHFYPANFSVNKIIVSFR